LVAPVGNVKVSVNFGRRMSLILSFRVFEKSSCPRRKQAGGVRGGLGESAAEFILTGFNRLNQVDLFFVCLRHRLDLSFVSFNQFLDLVSKLRDLHLGMFVKPLLHLW